jgi:hypothetical protein
VTEHVSGCETGHHSDVSLTLHRAVVHIKHCLQIENEMIYTARSSSVQEPSSVLSATHTGTEMPTLNKQSDQDSWGFDRGDCKFIRTLFVDKYTLLLDALYLTNKQCPTQRPLQVLTSSDTPALMQTLAVPVHSNGRHAAIV